MATAVKSNSSSRTVNLAPTHLKTTRPVRVLIYASLAILHSGPPSFRLDGRSPDAALSLSTALDARALIQVALIALATAIGCTLLARRDVRRHLRQRLYVSRQAKFLLAILFVWLTFSAISVIYSVSSAFTVLHWVKYVGLSSLYLLVIGLGRDDLSIARFLLSFHLLKMLVITAVALLKPELVGVAGRYHGGPLWPDYGSSAVYATISGLALYVASGQHARFLTRSLFRSRVFMWLLLAFSCGYAYASRTRSSMWTLILVLMVAAWILRARFLLIGTIALVVVMALFISPETERSLKTSLARDPQNIFSLSERDRTFQFTTEWAQRSPIIGSGYAAGSRAAMADYARDVNPGLGGPHDPFSATFADLGVLGLLLQVLLLICLFQVFSRIVLKSPKPHDGSRALAVFVACLVLASIALGVGLPAYASPLSVLVATVFLSEPRGTRRSPIEANQSPQVVPQAVL